MALNAFFALLSAAACGALGTLAAMRLLKRARRLALWREAFTRLHGALKFAAFSLPAALKYAARPDMPALRTLEERLGQTPGERPEALFASFWHEDALRPEDACAVLSGIRALEAVTLEEQCAYLSLVIERLERLEDAARRESDRLARLFVSGGCLSGAALMILLL